VGEWLDSLVRKRISGVRVGTWGLDSVAKQDPLELSDSLVNTPDWLTAFWGLGGRVGRGSDGLCLLRGRRTTANASVLN